MLPDGSRDILGLWIETTEGAKFWLKVFNDLKTRGVADILIAVTDGLKGIGEALGTVFPATTLQTCLVHLFRNSLDPKRTPHRMHRVRSSQSTLRRCTMQLPRPASILEISFQTGRGRVDMRVTIFGCSAAIWLLVLASGCATSPRWEQYSAPPAGTTWTNQFRSSGSYAGPAEVNSRMGQVTFNGKPHIAFHNGPTTLVALPDGKWVTLLGADGKPVNSWDPPTSFEWPMYVGREWKSSFKVVNHANSRTVAINANYVVEAFEDVTVPAGSFRTYRVRMTNDQGDDNTWWFCPDNGLFVKQKLIRTAGSPSGPGIREAELKALKIGG